VVTLGADQHRPIQLDLAPVLDDAGRLPSDADVDDWVAAQSANPGMTSWPGRLPPHGGGVVLRRALHRAGEEYQ